MYKAIFLDIDGTLRDNNKNISERTILAIKNVIEKGILVILCSGRARKYTEDISRRCSASRYIITSNGANVYNYEDERVIYKNVINKQAIIELYKAAEQANVRLVMDVEGNRIVNRLKYLDGSESQLDMDIETFVEENDVQLCTISDTNFNKMEDLKSKIDRVKSIEIKQQLKSFGDGEKSKEESMYYFIANKESCKGNAIVRLCEMLRIDLKDTVAIGDDYNDISMFKVVGYSVAMGNANDEVKEYTDEITLTNEHDGVAVFLENLLKHLEENELKSKVKDEKER